MITGAVDVPLPWVVALSIIPAATAAAAAVGTTMLNRRAERERTSAEHRRQDDQRRRDEEREDDARHLAERRSAYVALMVAAREADHEISAIMLALASDQPIGDESERLDHMRIEIARAHALVDMLASTTVRLAAIETKIAYNRFLNEVRLYQRACEDGTTPRPAPTGQLAASEALKEFTKQARFELGLDKPIPGVD